MNDDTTAGPSGVRQVPTRGGDQRSAANKLSAKERSAKALNLRLMRHSYDTIAKQLGYAHRSAARKAVERELAAIPREPAKELRAQELELLDLAQRAIMPSVLAGHLGAMDRLVKIMDARAKLTGLYENLTDSGIDEFKVVLRAWGQQIAAQVAADETAAASTQSDDVDAE